LFRGFFISICISVAVLVFVVSTVAQLSLQGEVVDVIDGKTIVVAISHGNVPVELQYIEVPIAGQALHDTVKDHLRTLVIGQRVNYRPRIMTKERTVVQLTMNGVDISQQMLRDGAAWHIPWQVSGQERTEFDAYAAMEAAAKNEKRGVWSIPGLKPGWESRPNNNNGLEEKDLVRSNFGVGNARPNRSGRSNPSFGDVGALVNRYDPGSRTGLLSTTFLPIQLPKDVDSVQRAAIDVTYYYKENDAKARKGSYVVSVAFLSQKAEFITNNELVVWDNGKIIVVGKPKRTVSKYSDGVYETLIYGLSRSLLEKAANDEAVYFKVGRHVIQLTGGRYLIYNMLQVTQ